VASVGRSLGERSGVEARFVHFRFPDIDRDNEFVSPVTPQELLDNRNDRVALSWWAPWSRRVDVRTELGAWDDEDDRGGDASLTLGFGDLLVRDTTTDLTVFGTLGDFQNVVGGRLDWNHQAAGGRWNLYYELTNQHFDGFTNDRDDLLQHRGGLSRDWWMGSGWTFSLWSEAIYYDEEGSLRAGFALQRSF